MDYAIRRNLNPRFAAFFADRFNRDYNLTATGISENIGVCVDLNDRIHSNGRYVNEGVKKWNNRQSKYALCGNAGAILFLNKKHYLTPQNIGSTPTKSFSNQQEIEDHLQYFIDSAYFYAIENIDCTYRDGSQKEMFRSTDTGEFYDEQGISYSLNNFSSIQEIAWMNELNIVLKGRAKTKSIFNYTTTRDLFASTSDKRTYKDALTLMCQLFRQAKVWYALLDEGNSVATDPINQYRLVDDKYQYLSFWFYKSVFYFAKKDPAFSTYLKDTILRKWAGASDFGPTAKWIGPGAEYFPNGIQLGGHFNALCCLAPYLGLENSFVNIF